MIIQRLFLLAALAGASAAWSAENACSGRLHIELQQAGVYALDYAAIIAAQPLLRDCRSDELELRNHDREVPLRVLGAVDGRFGPGAQLEWSGEPLHGPASWYDQYSVANVYLLSAEPGAHARLQTPAPATAAAASGALRTLHLEQDNLMIRLNQSLVQPGEEPDVWQWAKLTHVDPAPFSFDFDLADLAAQGAVHGTATVAATLDFRGMSDVLPVEGKTKPDDHVVELTLNGQALGPLHWDGRDEVRQPVHFPVALLRARGNTLALHIPQRHATPTSENAVVDVVMFNFIELAYPIAGSLDQSSAPFQLAGDRPGSLELQAAGGVAPAIYTAAGDYFTARAGGAGRWQFAALPAGVTLYPATPAQRLAPTRLLAVNAGDWRDSEPGYDYLIVAHPRLLAAIQPLAEFHRSRGLKVAVIDVKDLYDQFNGGIEHPRAISNLVQYALGHWHTKPHYLLLVGDASFDIRHDNPSDVNVAKWATHDYELLIPGHFDVIPATPYPDKPADLANRNLIPTWQFPSEEGQSASDNPFVSAGAAARDFYPRIAIGRLPVVEPAEVSAIVAKTIRYFTTPAPGSWRRDVLFIANEDNYFQHASDEIAARLQTAGFAARKIYGDAAEKDNLAHQSDIKQSLNDGQLLVHFLGHGGRFIWRTGPPDLHKNHDLFTLDDVSQLQNGARLPMVLSMTCYSAPFDNPTEDSIGERFLREPDKGAIAVFAASWRNSPDPAYSKALVDALLVPGQSIGDAIIQAKRGMQDRTLVETYNLLGDPALVLDRPKDQLTLAHDEDRWATRVAVRLPGHDLHGTLQVDWLDGAGKLLQTGSYTVDGERIDLPPPSGVPAAVRVYAVDRSSGRDAIGEMSLRAAPLINASSTAARPRTELALGRSQDRWSSFIEAAMPASEFHGEVTVDWQDLNGKTLLSEKFSADAPRFRLVPPSPSVLPSLAQVRVLTSDPRQPNDALGRLYLIEPPVRGRLIGERLPTADDRPDVISKFGFDTGATGLPRTELGQATRTPAVPKDGPG